MLQSANTTHLECFINYAFGYYFYFIPDGKTSMTQTRISPCNFAGAWKHLAPAKCSIRHIRLTKILQLVADVHPQNRREISFRHASSFLHHTSRQSKLSRDKTRRETPPDMILRKWVHFMQFVTICVTLPIVKASQNCSRGEFL